ncbi:TetR/AcrR family transcriptional regulator [Ramlibacter albus]|uniref:TetR/AcrR family transcriptional regulator n=1 Tax=Ramlibacter albus TaxID=2079448 RepID=A0A923MDW0_9BURK|nr:TetR/AcrR family transcriptional regulator [Ramlibacter albus]MBC5768220.1 TetR/AcrR family transcriptional regulator [Ramlibacter albus]
MRENPEELAVADEGPRRRMGGRSARVLDAVANAVLEELGESGIEEFSIPRVAARAGVSSSSVYRRWPNKATLIAFAGDRMARETIPFPDLGSLRQDLLRVLQEVVETFRDPKSRALIAMAFSGSDSPDVQRAQTTYWQMRVQEQQPMFDRAIARGEISPDTDTGAIIERAAGPLYFRFFISRLAITQAFLEQLVDAALAPVLAQKPRRR